MVYWGFPEISPSQRLSKAERLTPEAIRISPEAAYERAASTKAPSQARLTMLDGRPVYRFRAGQSEALVYADSGERLLSVPADMALRIAAAWTGQPAGKAEFEGSLNEPDQWTVSGEYKALRPLLKYGWPDGAEVYVSALTGDLVQHTTRASRIAARFGAIPHWLYWTPLRKNGRIWSRVVEWAAGIATGVSVLGLCVGIRTLPAIRYGGLKRWHVLLGLTFGTLACTWTFSGLLSMERFEWLSGNNVGAANVQDVLRGGSLKLQVFAPADALGRSGLKVKELDFILFGGEPYYLARESDRISRILPIQGNSSDQFDRNVIERLVAQASQPAAISQTRVITEYDAYYLDRHQQHPLPALFVRLNDAQGSAYYIDPKTAEIVEAFDNRSRWNRWLYHGLHSWNFPWLYRSRPAWDILVLTFLLGGTALSVSAVILGFQLLSAKLHTLVRTP